MRAWTRVLVSLLVLSSATVVRADAEGDVDDPEKAVKRFGKIVEKSPGDGEAWYGLGRAHLQLKAWPSALEALGKAEALLPQDARVQFRKGEALEGAGRPADAIAAYQAALALDPTMIAAQGKLASAYMGDKRYEDAIKMYKEALKNDPPDKGAYYTNLGTAYYRMGDTAQALRWFEKTVELAPDSATTYFNLGAMYRRLGKEDPSMLEKSAEAFAKAADLDKGAPRTQFLAAESLYFIGRKDQAKTYLDRFFALDPTGSKVSPDDFAAAKAYRADLAK